MSALLVGFGLFIIGISLIVGLAVHSELIRDKKSPHDEAQRTLSNYAKVAFVGILLTTIGSLSVFFIKSMGL